MLYNLRNNSASTARTLVASTRNFDLQVYLCLLYEFEDILSEIETVDLLCPQIPFGNSARLHQLLAGASRKVIKYTSFGSSINPYLTSSVCAKKYELFFVCLRACQMLFINTIKQWRKNCEIAACYIEELWPAQLENDAHLLQLLRNFDHIFVGFRSSVEPLQELIKRPCHYLPVGIDTLKFCPHPFFPPRVIDVYSLGRRSERIHEDLLKHSQRKNFLYIYDTLRDFTAIDHREHRYLIASLTKRSRYFIVNPAKFNLKSKTEGQTDVGDKHLSPRFLEGAAAAAVMVGTRPSSPLFSEHIPWPDAVIDVAVEKHNIIDIITELDAQPERLGRIRRDNLCNCLMRHDWAYRWQEVLETIGLSPKPELLQRKERLKEITSYCLQEPVQTMLSKQ